MYELIRMQYLLRRITAEAVWAKVDAGVITKEQATMICGPRGNEKMFETGTKVTPIP